MSIKVRQTIILKIKPIEYNLLMYLRTQEIDLEKLCPGSLVLHYTPQQRIGKHELHFYGKQLPVEGELDREFKACYTTNKEKELKI